MSQLRRMMMAKVASNDWMSNAMKLGIPKENLLAAYDIDSDIVKSFNGEGRCIKSTLARAYFDTEYYCKKNTEIECDFIMSTDNQIWVSMFGAETTEGHGDSVLFRKRDKSSDMTANFGIYNSAYGDYGNFKAFGVVGYRHTMKLCKDGLYVDGTLQTIYTPFREYGYIEGTLSIYLFGLHNNTGVVARMSNGNIYHWSARESGILKSYIVPIINDNSVAMYDLVNNKLISYVGSGIEIA